MSLEEVNPHYALLKSELCDTPEEVAFKHWCGVIEEELQIDILEGDEAVDGYCEGLAFDLFVSGMSEEEAIEELECLIERAKGPRMIPINS